MKSFFAFCLFIGLASSSFAAHASATASTNNGNKEQSDANGKDGNGKYTFALFNFFSTQTKAADDSSSVKKEEPALPKIKANSSL